MSVGPYSEGFYSVQQEGSRRSAEIVLPIVLELLKPTSVIDVGCGVGAWTRVLEAHVLDVVGVDGDWVPADSRSSSFVARDLEQSLSVDRTFDLAICMEVAEHLSPAVAERFISDLARLAPAVLFSAAIPQQGGTQHRNEQWQSYWAELFQRHGFWPHDVIRPRVWSCTPTLLDVVRGLVMKGDQAATFSSWVVASFSVTLMPSLNFTPASTSATSSWPLNRRQRSCALSSSL
jgi:cyclopropane fatty-acyl-phospholipid synthase-like methyltransferase